jgi:hypothetical protein
MDTVPLVLCGAAFPSQRNLQTWLAQQALSMGEGWQMVMQLGQISTVVP